MPVASRKKLVSEIVAFPWPWIFRHRVIPEAEDLRRNISCREADLKNETSWERFAVKQQAQCCATI